MLSVLLVLIKKTAKEREESAAVFREVTEKPDDVFWSSVSGGVLHNSGPDVCDDSSVLCLRGPGGGVRVSGPLRRLLPHHDGPYSVWVGRTHASLTGHRLPSGPDVYSHDSRPPYCWWEALTLLRNTSLIVFSLRWKCCSLFTLIYSGCKRAENCLMLAN